MKPGNNLKSFWSKRGSWLAGPFVIGFASLIWLLIRTGTKPSRAAYPCQRMAAANASAWLGAAVLPLVAGRLKPLREVVRPWAAAVVIFPVIIVAVSLTVVADATGHAAPIRLDLQDRVVGPAGLSDIFAVSGTNGADAGFRRLVSVMEDGPGFYERVGDSRSGIVAADDVVLIKINSQWDKRGGTNTDLLRSIIASIAKHPDGFTGEVIVADNGQDQFGSRGGGGSMDWRNNNALDRSQSVADVVRDMESLVRVSAYLWDDITRNQVREFSAGDYSDGYVVAGTPDPVTGIIVTYPKFTTLHGTPVSFKHGVWDAETGQYISDRLVVINVPVLKSHAIYGVTASVKHYMGVVSDKLTRSNAHRSVRSGGMGSQMAQTRIPDLNVIDAIWVNARPGNGPSANYNVAVQTGIIAASLDPVALDVWAAENVLVPAAAALGYDRTESMDPHNATAGSFGDWLKLSARELVRAGYPVSMDPNSANVRVARMDR